MYIKTWTEEKEDNALEGMKEGVTKALTRTAARKEKAGAAASRILACLIWREHNGEEVKYAEAAANLTGGFFQHLFSSPGRGIFGTRTVQGRVRKLGQMRISFSRQ